MGRRNSRVAFDRIEQIGQFRQADAGAEIASDLLVQVADPTGQV